MRKWVPVLAVLVVLSAIALLAGMTGAQGQKGPTGQVKVLMTFPGEIPEALRSTTVMMTLLRDGKPVKQTGSTWRLRDAAQWSVAPGTYEVRIEGESAETLSIRGIFVGEDDTTEVVVTGRPGSGCRVITYGAAELGRFGKSCGTDPSHLNAAPDQWQFCPVCGKKLQ
jgi:hypothetical protein